MSKDKVEGTSATQSWSAPLERLKWNQLGKFIFLGHLGKEVTGWRHRVQPNEKVYAGFHKMKYHRGLYF